MSSSSISRRARLVAVAGAVALGAATLAAPTATAAQGAWAPATTLSQADAWSTSTAAGPDGTTVIAYSRCPSDCQVEVAVRAPGEASFGTPTRVGAVADDIDGPSAVAVQPDGSIVLAWGAIDAGSGTTTLYTATRPAGTTTWSNPTPLQTMPDLEYLDLAVGADSTAAVGWIDYANREAYTSVRRGGSGAWSTKKVEADPGTTVYELTTTVGPDGSVVTVWDHSESTDDIDGYSLQYNTLPAGATEWSGPRRLRTGGVLGEYGDIAVSPSGVFHLVWMAYHDGEYVPWTSSLSSAAGTWTAPVPHDYGYGSLARLAVDGDGSVTVVWHTSEGSIESVHRTATGSWNHTTLANGEGSSPEVAAGADGTFTTVWLERVTDSVYDVRSRTRKAGTSTWTPVATLQSGSDDVHTPRVAVGPDGRATATWERDDRIATASTLPAKPLVKAAVIGEARTGETVECVADTFAAVSTKIAWYRGSKRISGSTGAKRTLKPADHGKKVSCEVTATNAGGSTVARSAGVTVKTGTLTLVKKPKVKVKGKVTVGNKLRATKGRWSAKVDSARYRWFSGKQKIKGKVGARRTYVATAADAGKKLSVRVTVKSDGYAKAKARSKAKKVQQ